MAVLRGGSMFTSRLQCPCSLCDSSIFGHEGQDADEVVYVNWLSMVRAGLLGLEFYTPQSKSWRQVICRTLLLAQSLYSMTHSLTHMNLNLNLL